MCTPLGLVLFISSRLLLSSGCTVCGLWHELSPVWRSWSSRGYKVDLAPQRSWHCTWERCEPTGHPSVPRMLWVTPRGSPHQLPSLPGTHIPPTGPPPPPLNPLWASVVSEMSCAAPRMHLLVCLNCCVCRLCADASACQALPSCAMQCGRRWPLFISCTSLSTSTSLFSVSAGIFHVHSLCS